MMMNDSRASVFPILWLSLVAFCDPCPSSGDSHHHTGGLGNDAKIRDTEHWQKENRYTSTGHSRRFFDDEGYGPTTSTTPFQPTFPRLSPISKMSANNSNLSTSTWWVTSPTQLSPLKSPLSHSTLPESVGNVSSDLFNSVNNRSSDANGLSPVNNPDSFNSIINGEMVKLEKGRPSSLDSSELPPESLEKSRHHPKLNLKLDRDYAPSEIAEYILRTGDEKGFAQTVGEMLQDGELMESKDDVILFLEMVQQNLDKIRPLKRRKRSHQSHHAL